MNDRRLFLQSLGMAMLAPLVGGAALAAPLEAAAAATATTGVRATALAGGMYLVNGWILTEADLGALGVHAL
jgi:hypothetical protein